MKTDVHFANEELEKIALASLCDAGNGAIEIPSPDLFFFPAHRTIYRGFVELEGRDTPPDIITLTQVIMVGLSMGSWDPRRGEQFGPTSATMDMQADPASPAD